MKMRKTVVLSCFVLGSALAGNSAARASTNLLTNGSFETGNLSGWDFSGNTGATGVINGAAQDGSFLLWAGPVGSDGIISQTFSDTPGQTLIISGWVAGNGSSPSDVSFSFNGDTPITMNPVPDQPYTQYTFTATATGTDTFAVSFRNDPYYISLDNFSILEAPTPEPSTYILMGIGVLGMAGMAYKKRNLIAVS